MGRLLLILAAIVAAAGSACAQECVLQRVVTLESPPQVYGHLMIPVTIQDHASRLVLDTGGAWSLLDKDFAALLALPAKGLSPEWGTYQDATGERISKYVRVPSMKIGNLPVKGEVDFLLAPIAQGQSLEEVGGSLGLNVISHYDVEIDNAHHLVTLYLPNEVEGCGVHWADDAATFHFRLVNEIPFTRVNVDGEDVDALIDTGSSTTLMDLDFARRHFNLAPNSPGVTDSGSQLLPGGKMAQFYRATVKKLTVSGITYENVPVELAQLEDTRLILGMHELKHLHLYFAFKRKTIYATGADAAREQAAPTTPPQAGVQSSPSSSSSPLSSSP